MSYILEALKKSEQERQQGHVPDLQTLQPQLLDSTHRSEKWPFITIGVLALALVFVLGWMRPWSQQQTTLTDSHNTEPTKSTPALAAVTDVKETNTSAHVRAIQQKPVRAPDPVVQQVYSEPPSLALESVPHLLDMPSLVQQAIPNMEFAGHVYTSNAMQRSVIINGRSMAEGEVLVEGLRIEQITQNGVVFSYQDQLFQMPILQDWAFD